MAFHMTCAAAQEILAAAERSDAAGMALRVAAKATPDGIAYGMGFDEPAPEDEVAVFDGLTVLIAQPSRPWLESTVLDFVDLGEGQRDFVFAPAAEARAAEGVAPSGNTKRCGGGGCSGCA